VLGLAVAGQVLWGETRVVREATAPAPAVALAPGLRTPLSDFVRSHVPTGQTIVFVTEGHGIPELFGYYELSYAMAPRNTIWWAADGTATTVVDWWLDVSQGSPRLVQVARTKGAAYLVFAGRPPPSHLPVIELWRRAADTIVRI
jgi:hypothetical protein